MPEPIETPAVATEPAKTRISPEQFLDNVSKMFSSVEVTAESHKAAAAPIGNPVATAAAIAAVAQGTTAADQKEAFKDPLRKSFETLASVGPMFGRFGSRKALDDPYGYLGAKNEKGRHVVKEAELDAMLQTMLAKGSRNRDKLCSDGDAIPLGQWMEGNGRQQNFIEQKMLDGLRSGQMDGTVAKALDTALSSGVGGGALIRTDIEAILYEAYLRRFPMAEVLRSFPSNGLVHTYDVRSGVGNAALVSELGDVVTAGADATSTIERKAMSNIGILVSRRGISLKLQFATSQSGMNFPLSGTENLEVIGGLTSIADLNQKLIFQGNFSQSGGTVSTEDGAYDVLGFDGFRQILKGAGTSLTWTAGDTHRKNLDRLIAQIDDAGGNTEELRIVLRNGARIAITDELDDFIRTIAKDAASTGIARNTLDGGFMTFGEIIAKFMRIPGSAQAKGIGYYDISSVSYEDAYVLDPRGAGLAYLGSPSPVILELPLGFDNKLGQVYLIFLMNGLVVTIPNFHRKYRIPKQTV
ncbi:MAG: hypothetical protein ABI977_22100 [Acidobacteriota bacterium]